MTTYNVVEKPASDIRPGDVVEFTRTLGTPELAIVTHNYVWTTGQTRIIEVTNFDEHESYTVQDNQMIPVLVRQS